MREKLKQFKHYLEAHAELAWKEKKTKAYIITHLGSDFVWESKTAVVYAVGSGPGIFFRAELDGLATSSGIAHVCGHAGHITALMVAYLYFVKHPPKNYTYYFVFQPSEEGYPSGAQFISETFSLLHTCLAGFAFHVYPAKQKGVLIDPVFAATDYFEVTIKGKGTHIKNKYTNTHSDVLLVASKLAAVINTKTFSQALINVGVLQAGETPNSIAGHAVLRGDVRALNEVSRKKVSGWLTAHIARLQQDTSITVSLAYNQAYPLLWNDQKLLAFAKSVLPVNKALQSYATEDFSLYPVPTVFLLVGTGNTTELHQVDFIIDDEVVEMIVAYWKQLGEAIDNKKLPFGSLL